MTQPTPDITPDGTVSFKIRDFIGIVIFLIVLGVTIGGYIVVINGVKDLSSKVDKISDKLDLIGQRTAAIEGYLKNNQSTPPTPAPIPPKR